MVQIDQISFFLPLLASLIFAFLLVGLVNLKEDQHKVLFAFFILLSINRIIAFFARVPEFNYIQVWIEPLAYLLILAIIPFYFLYLKTLINGMFFKTDLYHFIPAVILFLLFIIPYSFISYDEKIEYINHYDASVIQNNIINSLFSVIFSIVTYAYNTQLLLYFTLILLVLIKYLKAKTIRQIFQKENTTLKRIVIYVIAIVIVETYGLFLGILNLSDPIILSNLIFLVLIIFLGYFGLKQEYMIEKEVEKGSSNIPEDIEIQLFENIKELFDEKEIFLNSKLTLQNLVDELDSNKTYVSVVIREKFKENFISMLTKYRVDRAKKLLLEKNASNYSLEGIGKISGFNLKSTFYTAFKKETGYTPANYIRQMKTTVDI